MPCLICGDKAQGINFNVLTCMSCKTFFRRNAPRENEFSCPLNNSCPMTPVTRKFCTKCRLQKCFAVGMRKELIQLDARNRTTSRIRLLLQGIQATEQNENRDFNTNQRFELIPESVEHVSNNDERDCDEDFIEKTFASLSESEINQLMEMQMDLSNYFKNDNFLRALTCNTDDAISHADQFHSPECFMPDGGSQNYSNMRSLLATQHGADFIEQCLMSELDDQTGEQHDPIMEYFFEHPIRLGPELGYIPANRELANEEKYMFAELNSACHLLRNPYRQLRHLNYYQSIKSSRVRHYFFQRLLGMCKRLNSFASLSPYDQSQLIKFGLLEMLLIRSVLLFDPDRNCWNMVDDNSQVTVQVPTDFLNPALDIEYNRHSRYPHRFKEEWKRDEVIFDLLTAIVLFHPRSEFTELEEIKSKHMAYTRLLSRYLELKYPSPVESAEVYQQLMESLKEAWQIIADMRSILPRSLRLCVKDNPLFAQVMHLEQIEGENECLTPITYNHLLVGQIIECPFECPNPV